MRTVVLGRPHLDRIEQEARLGYPDEACGFLFADASERNGGARLISGVEAAPNEFAGERRRRFVISPTELHAAEERAGSRGEIVCGFYHSHPDHPALPSAFDTEHAWPWYTYVVISVSEAGPQGIGAFELEEERRRFLPCPLTIDTGAGTGTAAAGSDPGR